MYTFTQKKVSIIENFFPKIVSNLNDYCDSLFQCHPLTSIKVVAV